MRTHDDYWFVYSHPELSQDGMSPTIEITPHMVDPSTDTIRTDQSKNTKLQWWIEVVVHVDMDGYVDSIHDVNLDCGGDTIDEAVQELKRLVIKQYGDYKEDE